jgi:hypothetical protein
MNGEKNLSELIKNMTPKLNKGAYVFLSLVDVSIINRKDTICEFKEAKGTTVVVKKELADSLKLQYQFVASWITLEIHSSLEAVGLTALFSSELTKHKISCNVIAGYYHDHIFVDKNDGERAILVLNNLAKSY